MASHEQRKSKISFSYIISASNSCKSPAFVKELCQKSRSYSSCIILQPKAWTGSLGVTSGENGNWSNGLLIAEKSSTTSEQLSAESTSDQKLSSSSEKFSDGSDFMDVLLFLLSLLLWWRLLVTEEKSLIDELCVGELGLWSMLSYFKVLVCSFASSCLGEHCRFVSWTTSWLDCLSLFFRWVCHTFFISLSVRPGNLAAIADHLQKVVKISFKILLYKIDFFIVWFISFS